MAQRRSGTELLVDVTVFAPVGLIITAAEALPELARKGRARLVPRIGLARTVGRFAVQQGYRQLTNLASEVPGNLLAGAGARLGGAVPWARSTDGARGQEADGRRAGGATERSSIHVERPSGTRPAEGGTGTAKRPGAPHSGDLAIPSYDSLSAPQVVQRLAGLSREEIEAVRRYEAATRGRRTILARAEQLLA